MHQENYLVLKLPDGKRVFYGLPQIKLLMPGWHDVELNKDCADNTCSCEPKDTLTYMRMKNGSWLRTSTYGGKLVENYVQAVSRQLLVNAMLRVDERWKEIKPSPITMTVYDEIVCEAPKGFICPGEFRDIISQSPGNWADELTIRADVWQGRRYRK